MIGLPSRENRREIRRPARHILLRLRGVGERRDTHAWLRDRSPTGLGLRIPLGRAPDRGQQIQVAYLNRPIKLICQVVYVADTPTGCVDVGCRLLQTVNCGAMQLPTPPLLTAASSLRIDSIARAA
jgi:hypothetical protein